MILALVATIIGFALVACVFAWLWESDRWKRSKLSKQLDEVCKENDKLNDGINTLTAALFESGERLAKCEKTRIEALNRVGKQVEVIRENEAEIARMNIAAAKLIADLDAATTEITALRLRVDEERKASQKIQANLNRVQFDFENERARVKVIKEKVASA